MKMLRKGEYDMVNISLIGHDPITGRSFEECHAEWKAERDCAIAEWNALPWWRVIRNIQLRWKFVVLSERYGML
jgi:hypothetical protein